MKTIPKNHRHLSRMFSAQAIRPRPNPLPPIPEDNTLETAGHDFLVLSARPDLTPQLMVSSPFHGTPLAS